MDPITLSVLNTIAPWIAGYFIGANFYDIYVFRREVCREVNTIKRDLVEIKELCANNKRD